MSVENGLNIKNIPFQVREFLKIPPKKTEERNYLVGS